METVRRTLTAQLKNLVSFVLNLIDFIKLYVCSVGWRIVLYVLKKIVVISAWRDISLKRINVVYVLKAVNLVLLSHSVKAARMDFTQFSIKTIKIQEFVKNVLLLVGNVSMEHHFVLSARINISLMDGNVYL